MKAKSKKISDEDIILQALEAKGWTDGIAYYDTETFRSKNLVWTVEFEINHSDEKIYDQLLILENEKIIDGSYVDGVITGKTIEIVLNIINKLPYFK